ncbi:hypothetical protein [Methanofollis fontis]|uniref:Uncharacterized protein n=1 Tax=Methanofollis fontis TaxID=2052832 RepID=A0A483CWJ1_9EURY|nr:hypothetical protein [Methanofollis fontis]TAJ45570.1 hypothetical protein CUJ86_02260 [Methanofollis fontis]
MADLPPDLCREIDRLLADVDLAAAYQDYRWKADSWMGGFPGIRTLEWTLSNAARQNRLGYLHAMNVAIWGGLPDPLGIRCERILDLPLYANGAPAPALAENADALMEGLQGQIRGFGPVYCSKMLRFAVPSVFGALDTPLVRAFGADGGICRLIDLRAEPSDPGDWPAAFRTWTLVLHRIAGTLNAGGIECPHPASMIASGLREPGVWLPADVGMALFSRASRRG